MTVQWQETPEEVHVIAERLEKACREAGLSAEVLGPTRIRAWVPNANPHLAEIIKIRPDENEVLSFYWSWDERICPAAEIDTAVTRIKHVVTPSADSKC
ncbi:hypothetical protein [Actinoallomurus sp. NPDC050550]|uniref:hypothetical protein n=1 Tax=Actinoallomurus sp. NPDC050550 TaxID=3154937 RepID=UPI0034062EDB